MDFSGTSLGYVILFLGSINCIDRISTSCNTRLDTYL